MQIQYITSPEQDFSSGIDARSSENQIDAGFVRDLLNANIVKKRPRKRRGYQGFAGNIPVRVTSMDYKQATNQVCFTLDSALSLDSSVSLESVRSTPIVVYGRSSIFGTGDGPLTDVDSVHYYTSFTIPTRKTLTAPSDTLIIEAAEHGIGSTNMFVGIVEATSLSDRSYEQIYINNISINESTFDLTLNSVTDQDEDVFVYFSDKDTSTGESYVFTATHTGSPNAQTFSIPASTHNLTNFNITVQVQQDTGASRALVNTESFLVANNGDVSVTIVNGTGSSQTYYVILSAAGIGNSVSGVVNASSTGTVQIPVTTSPWIFYSVYLEQTPGGTKELVLPETITYDDTTGIAIISFTNAASIARNFIIYYEYGNLRSNQLCVTDMSVTATGTDSAPQVTLWGLDHDEIYLEKTAREGWVTHVDSYRRSGEQRMISGLGGNLFSARMYDEAGIQYGYSQLFPRLFSRSDAARVLGPLFWDTGETPNRTRGYITGSSSGTNWVSISSVQYDPGGYTKYTLSIPGKSILDSTGSPTSLSSVISVTSGLEDYLTVQGMSYSLHNGTFRIISVQDGSDEIILTVDNAENSADYNDSNTAGEGGVFTDQLTWTAATQYIPDDMLFSEPLSDIFLCAVITSTSLTTVISGVTAQLQIPAGVLFEGQRISDVVPLRTGNPSTVPSTQNLVRGDMLFYSGEDVLNNKSTMQRLLRVKFLNPNSDISVSITSDSTTATLVLGSEDTSGFSIGNKILLANAGMYSGSHEITGIPSLSSLEFSTTETVSGMGTLVGFTAQLDESFSWEDTAGDTNAFTSLQRWIPIEAPDDSYDLTPNTHTRYFDRNIYTDQPFLRSSMLTDNMYFTNYDDETYKFDGSNMYRAGLPEWQPGLFLTQETTGATIVTNLRQVAYSAIFVDEGKVQVLPETQQSIPVGANIKLTGSTQTYTIRAFSDDGTDFFILLDRTLDSSISATGTTQEIGTYRYYFRLNAVDINNNIVASATTGSQDYVVELVGNAAVQLKLVGMPAWDAYDFDRLEVQIYRTLLNQSAPFYLVTTIPMDFNNTQGYITYRDSFTDSDLSQLDIVNTALKGAELGTAWTGPLRAKYNTSIGNKYIQANIRDYSQLDLQIVGDATLADSDFDGNTLLFRRDDLDTGTTTDMVNRVKYQWVNGFTDVASSFTIGVNQFNFDAASLPGTVDTGDWIYLGYAAVADTGRQLEYAGWYQVASVTGTTVTVNLIGATSAASYPDSYCIATDSKNVPVLLGTDGNLGMFDGDSFTTFDVMRRMSLAINASMRMVDISLGTMDKYTPWLITRGGNDLTPAGRLIIRQPRADASTFSVLPTFSNYSLFVNSVRTSSGSSSSASTRIFPSRILASYENYAEIFDNPTAILDTDSDSAVDVNPADGQEITGVIPFFGQAAFTAAQKSAILVCFKTNSIYLVDLNEKAAGRNPVQRIETQGLGCTAPYSIAPTKNGVMFANESGMYCLRQNQTIQYLGEYMERNWTELVDLDKLNLAHGHHYGVGRSYKLSVSISADEQSNGYVSPNQVYVYDHTAEDQGKTGAWDRYDNHPSIGWANLGSNAFFASTTGRVFILRNTNEKTDFRDDDTGILFRLDTRANDFGNSGIRKVLDNATVHYRTNENSSNTTVSYSTDLDQEYTETTEFNLIIGSSESGLSDTSSRDIISLRHSLSRRRGIYVALRIENNGIDESLEVAGIDYKVGGLTDKGIQDAGGTK